jgi:hypothetical protein
LWKIVGLLSDLGAVDDELTAAGLVAQGWDEKVIREFGKTFACEDLLARIRSGFRKGRFEDALKDPERWRVRGKKLKTTQTEPEQGGIRMTTDEPAFLEYDGTNPAGIRACLKVQLRPGGWGAMIVHRTNDAEMDMIKIIDMEVQSVRMEGSEETVTASFVQDTRSVEIEVVPHKQLLVLFVNGRYLHALKPKGTAVPTQLRIGVNRGELLLEKVEFRR